MIFFFSKQKTNLFHIMGVQPAINSSHSNFCLENNLKSSHWGLRPGSHGRIFRPILPQFSPSDKHRLSG